MQEANSALMPFLCVQNLWLGSAVLCMLSNRPQRANSKPQLALQYMIVVKKDHLKV